jgi:hypothetical protein
MGEGHLHPRCARAVALDRAQHAQLHELRMTRADFIVIADALIDASNRMPAADDLMVTLLWRAASSN